jgi:hypothetical protein
MLHERSHTVESQATYLRIHLLQQLPPPSCMREVKGSVDYAVIGWSVHMSYFQVALLLPMTIINLSTFVILILAMCKGSGRYQYTFKPQAHGRCWARQ